MTTKTHTPFNKLLLANKDLAMFPIVRVVTATERYWEVTDLRRGQTFGETRQFGTRREAELAVLAVVKFTMKGESQQ